MTRQEEGGSVLSNRDRVIVNLENRLSASCRVLQIRFDSRSGCLPINTLSGRHFVVAALLQYLFYLY